MENTHNFRVPRTNLIGVGAIKDLPTELLTWKLKKALIVTDKNMITLGHVEKIEMILKSLFIFYDIFDGIEHPNPTVSFVEAGVACFKQWPRLFKRYAYDMVISVGGGSNHDAAKGIATVVTNGKPIGEFEGYNKLTKPALPHIAINTTAGSAAELTWATIIRDETRKVKMTLVDPRMIPLISVNDPMFMVTMPREVTASSGIDVVAHAIEAYSSTESSPMSDHLALGALRLAGVYLRRAYENGYDLEAREQMMFAGIMAGMAFNNAGLGYVHALAHQLGGFYAQAHGVYNALLLPPVLEFNAVALPEQRLIAMAEALSGETIEDKPKALKNMVATLRRLSADIGIPKGLKEMGVEKEVLDGLAKNALKDICVLTNPRQGELEEVLQIYLAAM